MKEAKVDDKERLKELRKETGLSQTKFAERLKYRLGPYKIGNMVKEKSGAI